MNCSDFRALMDDYADDLLSAEDHAHADAHLADCPACRAELQKIQRVKALLSELPDSIPVPLAAQAAWRNAVLAESRKNPWKIALRALSGVAAAAVILFGSTFALDRMGVFAPGTNRGVVAMSNDPDFDSYETENRNIALLSADGLKGETPDKVFAASGSVQLATFRLESASFEQDVKRLDDLIAEYDGFVRSETESAGYVRMASRSILLSQEIFDDFAEAIKVVGALQYSQIDRAQTDANGEVAVEIYLSEAAPEAEPILSLKSEMSFGQKLWSVGKYLLAAVCGAAVADVGIRLLRKHKV